MQGTKAKAAKCNVRGRNVSFPSAGVNVSLSCRARAALREERILSLCRCERITLLPGTGTAARQHDESNLTTEAPWPWRAGVPKVEWTPPGWSGNHRCGKDAAQQAPRYEPPASVFGALLWPTAD